MIRPFSSSITRRSGRSSSSGSRFCRAANKARQQAQSGFSAFSTSSCGTGPSIGSMGGIQQVGEETSTKSSPERGGEPLSEAEGWWGPTVEPCKFGGPPPPATLVPLPVGLGPDRIVMVARVLRIDGDDRQMRQVLAQSSLARGGGGGRPKA